MLGLKKLLIPWGLCSCCFLAAATVYAAGSDVDHCKPERGASLIASDDFTGDLSQWLVEQQDASGIFRGAGDFAELIQPAGATLWFNQAFSGFYAIELDVVPIPYQDKNGAYRLSDLNLFWNAEEVGALQPDPRIQARNGALASYNNLRLYYLGFGANYNKTTRLRRYDGTDERPLLDGYAEDSERQLGDKSGPMLSHTKLEPNQRLRVSIISGKMNQSGEQKFSIYANQNLIFSYVDAKPLSKGWFAFRTTTSHFQLKRFRVYQCH